MTNVVTGQTVSAYFSRYSGISIINVHLMLGVRIK